MRHLFAIAALMIIIGALVALCWPGDAAPPQVPDLQPEPPPQLAKVGAATNVIRRSVSEGAEDRRSAEAGRGTLVVKCFLESGDALPGILVGVYSEGGSVLGVFRTDSSGAIEALLPPQTICINAERGLSAAATIVATRRTYVEMKVEGGGRVQGVVNNRIGQAVAGAAVYVLQSTMPLYAASHIATTDNDGKFEASGLPLRVWLGARANGYCPSTVVGYESGTAKSEMGVELLLGDRDAATLKVCVMDSDARGKAEVTVTVGGGHPLLRRLDNGRMGQSWPPIRNSTGPGGIVLRAGDTHEVALSLCHGGSVTGVVVDEKGSPVVATIEARPADESRAVLPRDRNPVFAPPTALSASNGEYVLSNVPAGRTRLSASVPGQVEVPEQSYEVLVTEDGQVAWNPIMRVGGAIVGRLVYADEAPVIGAAVSLSGALERRTVSNATGAFEFSGLPAASYSISSIVEVSGGHEELRSGQVWPRGALIQLKAAGFPPPASAWGTVTGRVVDFAGRAGTSGNLSVALRHAKGVRVQSVLEKDRFHFRRIPPGAFVVCVLHGESPIHVTRAMELASGEARDIGDVVTEPSGSLEVRLVRDVACADVRPTICVRPLAASHASRANAGAREVIVLDGLCIGPCEVSIAEDGVIPVSVVSEVNPGQVGSVTLQVQPAKLQKLVLEFEDVSGYEYCGLATADGQVVWEAIPQQLRQGRVPIALWLPAGPLTLVARRRDGASINLPVAAVGARETVEGLVLRVR
jgi:hypothetical protein